LCILGAEISHDHETQVFAAPDYRLTAVDGGYLLNSANPLRPHEPHVGHWIRRWAALTPDALMIADRGVADVGRRWQTVTYGAALARINRLSQALIDLGLSSERPLVVLSEKSVRHGLLMFAAMQVGIPAVSLSASWSMRPEAHDRLRQAIDLITPGVIYAEDATTFGDALAICTTAARSARVACAVGAPGHPDSIDYDEMENVPAGGAVEDAFGAVSAGTTARIMFTSGSTGPAKAVRVTHGMLTSNQQALRQIYPFLAAGPPRLVDWQPWHHCGGGAINLNAAISNGGSYYCDLGKPVPGAFQQTIDNLQDMSPTLHFNVPLGYDLLVDAMERGALDARTFFREMRLIIYSAAGMPQSLWDRLAIVAREAGGGPVPMVSSYGMTEMAPMHTAVHWRESGPGQIGGPAPGCEIKLQPAPDNFKGGLEGRFELRARGPNITPGYFRQPNLTADIFDDDGWFVAGDAVRFVDPVDPNRGLLFDGRLVEQFKLQSGTWVMAGDLRTAVMSHLRPIAQDVLVVGENEKTVGLLVFLDLEGCQAAIGAISTLAEGAASTPLAREIAARLAPYNLTNSASSRRIDRFLLLNESPSFGAGETTDKGYINQRLAIRRRQTMVEELYDPAGLSPRVHIVGEDGD
jgi:feruloyl-CoA synthase